MGIKLILALLLSTRLTFALAKDPRHLLANGKEQEVGGKQEGNEPSRGFFQRGKRPETTGQDGSILADENNQEPRRIYEGKQGKTENCHFRGITMFDKTVWSPKPCVACLCSGGEVVCHQIQCPALHCQLKFQQIGECCPICIDSVSNTEPFEFSGDSTVASDHAVISLTQMEKKKRQKKNKEERFRKKELERKQRKKQKREEAERKRKLKKAKVAKEQEEKKRRLREEKKEREKERRRTEEQRRNEEQAARRLELEQRELLRVLEEVVGRGQEGLRGDEPSDEVEVWLRGDNFQMPDLRSTRAPPFPLLEPTEPTEEEPEGAPEEPEVVEEEKEITTTLLPQGCLISDVIITCENAKLTGIPPLSIPELKSLNLQGNEIKTIPAGAFNGIPNLEWIDLSKNLIVSSGIDPRAFKGLKFLSRLYMDGNLLEQIPPELPSTLQELKINENNLKEIEENSFEGLSSLVTLEMEGNLLSEANVSPRAFQPLEELNYLRLNRNHFRTIPQALPTSLLELYLENNGVEEISATAFNNSPNINVVVLRHNKLDESRIAPLAWIHHRNLESLDLSHNNFYLVPSFLPKSLVHLVLAGNQIERIPGYVFAHMEPGLEYLYLSYNKLDGDGVEPESFLGTLKTMTELCLDHNHLTAVPMGINEMTSLHFLRLNNNRIRHVSEDAICDPLNDDDSHLVALRLENNLLDPRDIPPTAFSCVRSYSSVVLKPQRIK